MAPPKLYTLAYADFDHYFRRYCEQTGARRHAHAMVQFT